MASCPPCEVPRTHAELALIVEHTAKIRCANADHTCDEIDNLMVMDQDGGTTGPRPPAGADGQRDPSTHQLRTFLAAAKELHFGRAAARMQMTQPALSKQIRALEERLAVELFERNSRAVTLTAPGQELVAEAEQVVGAMRRLRQRVCLSARDVRGRLVVGFAAWEGAMPHTHLVLDALHERHPGIDVELRALTFADQFDAPAGREVDAAFLRLPLPKGLQRLPLAVEPRLACLPATDPLATAGPITLERLRDRPVIDMPARTPRAWRDDWGVDPRPDGSPVRYGPIAPDLETLLHIVGRGHGMCFLPAAVSRLYPRPGVAYVEVTDLPSSTAVLAWSPANRERPTVAALREAARVVTTGRRATD